MSNRHYHRPHTLTGERQVGGHLERAWQCECGQQLDYRRARDTDPVPFPKAKT